MNHRTARLLALLAIVVALAVAIAGAWGSRTQVEASSSVEAFAVADAPANLTW